MSSNYYFNTEACLQINSAFYFAPARSIICDVSINDEHVINYAIHVKQRAESEVVKITLPEGVCSGIVCHAGFQRKTRLANYMLGSVRPHYRKTRKNRV